MKEEEREGKGGVRRRKEDEGGENHTAKVASLTP
jgi:hypothetical protein